MAWNLEPRPGVNYTRRSSVSKQGHFLVSPLRRTSSGSQACRGEARLLDSVVQYGRNKAEELLVFDCAGQTLGMLLLAGAACSERWHLGCLALETGGRQGG